MVGHFGTRTLWAADTLGPFGHFGLDIRHCVKRVKYKLFNVARAVSRVVDTKELQFIVHPTRKHRHGKGQGRVSGTEADMDDGAVALHNYTHHKNPASRNGSEGQKYVKPPPRDRRTDTLQRTPVEHDARMDTSLETEVWVTVPPAFARDVMHSRVAKVSANAAVINGHKTVQQLRRRGTMS